ncbi:MAG: type IV secretory system conjugative DNA transfer family protein, partial [Chloroflexota bacterium]|nr:type IV secretory system conjugative DNA transfer family protein [Chloroflexota bacterium]
MQPDILARALAASPTLVVIAVILLSLGGVSVLLVGRSNSTSSSASTRTLVVRRPGWIARRRARGGITHRHDRVGIGYASATKPVHLSLAELAGHGLAVGGPKSGKTTFLQLLIEASASRLPVVIVDPKGSPALEATVRAHGGQVWTLEGKLPADLLDPRPWQVSDLLLEAEDYSADARAYRDAAHQRALWAAWALALEGAPMDLARLRQLLDREALVRALVPHAYRDPRIGDWLERLEHQRGGIEDSGARGLDRSLGTLLDGVAMRGSPRSCPEALRLEDVLDTRGLVLFSLDEMQYPHATRKLAAWVLLAMGRLARQLPVGDDSHAPRALLLVDEVAALDGAARHLRGLVGRAREAGLSVVMATQGLTDLEAVDHALVHQVLQDTAWQMGFRQGSPRDAEHMQALFG